MFAPQTIRCLIAFVLFLSHLLSTSNAQFTITLSSSPTSATTETSVLPFGSFPTADSAGFANNNDGSPSFGSYYFILIGIFFLFLIVVFFVLRSARRRIFARRQAAGQTTTDLEARHWPGRPWRTAAVADPRREEGFNESGEAPPPYIPGETPATYSNSQGQSIALMDLSGKPPDYERHLTQEDTDLTRPPPMHHPDNRYASTSQTTGAAEA